MIIFEFCYKCWYFCVLIWMLGIKFLPDTSGGVAEERVGEALQRAQLGLKVEAADVDADALAEVVAVVDRLELLAGRPRAARPARQHQAGAVVGEVVVGVDAVIARAAQLLQRPKAEEDNDQADDEDEQQEHGSGDFQTLFGGRHGESHDIEFNQNSTFDTNSILDTSLTFDTKLIFGKLIFDTNSILESNLTFETNSTFDNNSNFDKNLISKIDLIDAKVLLLNKHGLPNNSRQWTDTLFQICLLGFIIEVRPKTERNRTQQNKALEKQKKQKSTTSDSEVTFHAISALNPWFDSKFKTQFRQQSNSAITFQNSCLLD